MRKFDLEQSGDPTRLDKAADPIEADYRVLVSNPEKPASPACLTTTS